MKWDVIIIGGGPAGLAAAAMLKDLKVLLLEKKHCLGSKLLISGAGQCNLTHEGPIEDYELSYGKQWRFVRDVIQKFGYKDTIQMFKSFGLETITLENGKVFPKSLKASDVVEAFNRMLISNHIKVNLNEKVKKIDCTNDTDWRVYTNQMTYDTSHLIVATGGLTYPNTGSEGDAFRFAESLGVECTPRHLALAPVYCDHHPLKELSGLSFKNATVAHYRDKKINQFKGDLLITHFGFSGPVILNNSRYIQEGDVLKINFTEYNDVQILEKDLMDAFLKSPKRTVKNILQEGFLFNRLVDQLLLQLNFDPTVTAAEFKKQDRKKLIALMFDYECFVNHVGKTHIAMVTAGGIATAALDKKQFVSKKYPCLYFVGECVDVDGDTGGYNIQFAISSGVAAGKAILELEQNK